MGHRETVPAWVVRQANRRAARYADDKVVRWITVPTRKARDDQPAKLGLSSNDNLIAFTRTVHSDS